jgi:hypothetical protein
MGRRLTGLLASLLLVASVGNAAAKAPTCDRACLRGAIDGYLHALVAHRPGLLSLALGARFTENGQDLRLGEGLWRTAGGVGPFRQDILDVREGVAGSYVVVQVQGKPALLVLRLKLKGRKLAEIETQLTYDRADGALFDPAALKAASPAMTATPDAATRASRDQATAIAGYYPRGLQEGSFVTVDAPFAPDAYRSENGVFTAGPPCTRNEDCKNIKTENIAPGRTSFQTKVEAVDEEAGIVWLRRSWARGPGSRLVVWEAFKIWGGQIHAVEAFMKRAPLGQTSGWD